jgi:hypothetical protein
MDKVLTLAEFARAMAPAWERERIRTLGELAPDLFGLALRNAAEAVRWWSFWL